MWRCDPPSTDLLPDVTRFLHLLNASVDFFTHTSPLYVARAPGRLDLMGGIADYSGALVLELPLAVATLVAIQETPEPFITIMSTTAAEIGSEPLVTIPLTSLHPPDKPYDNRTLHHLLTADPRQAWAAYIVGVIVLLQQEYHLELQQGLRIMASSELPLGKGISSSAALEVATMQALCSLLGLTLDGRKMALLCQRVENTIVGAPCGIMDQMTVACGTADTLLALLCQPAEIQPSVPLPAEIEVWGIDSGLRHAVTGSDYGAVRVGAFMGYRIIAELAGLTVTQKGEGQVEIVDPLWGGYLANISPSLWETTYRDHVPLEINGAAFLKRYGGSTDTVTRIDPQKTYAVRQPTAHPIYEHHRVRLFRALLEHGVLEEEHLLLLGELMYQSHMSYSACGIGSEGTDSIVEMVRQKGPQSGLYGAKITGGGSGGTVAVLARSGARKQIEQIVMQYEQQTGRHVVLLSGSSLGAAAWGSLRLVQA